MSDGYERHARRIKALDYADALQTAGVSADAVDSLDDAAWDLAAALCFRLTGRRHRRPSDATKALVRTVLVERGRVAAMTDDEIFEVG